MKAEDISWPIGDTTVDATVTAPDQPGTYPGVVLVAGSGPTDRNWESPVLPGSNGSGRLLAEELAAAGYVTIRYDKRASGPRAEQNLAFMSGRISLESHFKELRGAVAHLADRPDVDPAHLFALASSEGAVHVLHYHTQPGVFPFTGMVLTGAPGRALSEIANYQVVSQLASLPNGDDLVSRYNALIRRFEDGLPYVPDPVLPELAANLVASLSAPLNQPFSREFWSFRPADYLQRVTQPVLVVIGRKDIQTDWMLDGKVLEEACLGKDNVSFSYPENANHVLKHEPTPREELTAMAALSNYNAPETSLDPEALTTIIDWLQRHSVQD